MRIRKLLHHYLLFLLLLIAFTVAVGGCQSVPVEEPIPPDPFTVTSHLGEEQRTVTFRGDSAGHIAGQESLFYLRLINNSKDEMWQADYCVLLLDTEGIVMEVECAPFYIQPKASIQKTIPVIFPENLSGAYGISVLIPGRGESITTIWIGEKTNTGVGPWPDNRNYRANTTAELSLAEEFIRKSPTFQFDGIEESLTLVETLYPDIKNTWQFLFQFESRQAGYGDRTGQMLAQVITPHEAIITVEDGQVKSAILDNQWDMVNQKLLK